MLQNNEIPINQFITITSAGVKVATFTQIRAALIARYKLIYGSDIDLSTASADGVFVNDLALIINNILQGMNSLYQNLNVLTANGVYLDALCALSNVTRKPATYSNASIQVKNGASALTITNPVFVDQAGNEWIYEGILDLDANETKEVTVTCTIPGPVQAPAGWINNTVEIYDIEVTQASAANAGKVAESDGQLRERRNRSNAASGYTVLESLIGALLNLSGIEDVYVYNNNSSSNMTAKDGTTVDPHSIYTIVRREAGVTVEDSVIGTVIHDKLTPGIHSCDSNGTSGTAKSYEYIVQMFGMTIADSSQNVYWKDATGIAPKITIELTPKSFFTTDEIENVGQQVINFLNELPISTDLQTNQVLVETMNADPLFMGQRTYDVGTITFTSTSNPDTFYAYSKVSYEQSGNKYVMSLS